jgi:hypothetical protein
MTENYNEAAANSDSQSRPIAAGMHAAAQITRVLLGMAITIAPVVVAVCAVGVIVFASLTVRNLFVNHLGADEFMAWLAVFASVGMTLAMLAVIVLNRDHTLVEGLGGIYLMAFAFTTLTLCALNTALDAAQKGLLAVTVPVQLSNMGSIVASVLAAIGLAPVITLPLANFSVPKNKYPSAAAAMGFVVSVIAKAVGVIASSVGTFYFGYQRTGNAFLSFFVAALYESCFLWAYLAFTRARQKRDVFDRVVWGALLILFGAFIASVSVEALSTLAGSTVAPEWLRSWGETLYVSVVGVTVGLTVLAHLLTDQISFTADDVRAWWADRDAPIVRDIPVRDIPAMRFGLAGMSRAGDSRPIPLNKDAPTGAPKVVHELPPGDPDDLHKLTARTCAHCGREFTGRGRSKYCGARCKKRALRARQSEAG